MSARGWMVLAVAGFWMGLLGALTASGLLTAIGIGVCAGSLFCSVDEWRGRK